MFSYKTRYGSKAERVFSKSFDFKQEKRLKRELLIYLLHNKDHDEIKSLMEFKPMDFDIDYLDGIFKSLDGKHSQLFHDLECHYGEMDKDKLTKRLQVIDNI